METLRRAVTSALSQTYGDFEIVISDNESTDESLETIEDLVSDPRVRLLRGEINVDPIPNWKKAIEASKGGYIKIIWSDDWIAANTVRALIEPLIGDPAVGFSVCRQTIHYPGGESQRPAFPDGPVRLGDLIDSQTELGNLPVSPGAAMVRR